MEIYLNRHPQFDGKYEMFVMGWGASTRVDVDKYDVRNPAECASHIRKCLKYLEEKEVVKLIEQEQGTYKITGLYNYGE